MASLPHTESQQDRKRAARRQYYVAKLEEQREKNRERARKKATPNRHRNQESPVQREERKQRHREAQARYRAANRLQLRVRAWQDRYRLNIDFEGNPY
ncbi:hypothetical protein CVT26_012212 [Gymnopilus dilepis]|uniref:Uncharacterized protein n=1 Tax=Gymnopilus dilepis TaxID=231916 RepID=A0A409YC90_9AGAR|nr:hypothetical protein CVT26_012212 [Gymnopilus dilepis]